MVSEDPAALAANARIFLWSTVDSVDEFDVHAFVSVFLKKFRPRPAANAGIPSGKQIGELVKDVVGTAIEAERTKFQKQLEVMHTDQLDTCNSVNALSATAHSSRLHKEQLKYTELQKTFDKLVAEAQENSADGEIPPALKAEWEAIKKRKRTLAIIAAKEAEGSMQVYEYMEDS